MKNAPRLIFGLALAACLLLNPASLAEDEQLQLARGLYDMQEYVSAQEALMEVARDQLTDDEVVVYDKLLAELREAIQASAKAKQEMADGRKAYDEGRWEEADALYASVLKNAYASETALVEAREQRQRIVEKMELSEAAKPSGPVQTEPAEEPTEPAESTEEVEAAPAEAVVEETIEEAPAIEEKPSAKPAAPSMRRRTLVDDLRARDELLWQRAVAKMQESAQKAGEAAAAEDFDTARQLAESALQVIEANRGYASPASKYEAARAIALELKTSIAKLYDAWSRSEAEAQRMAIADQIERRRRIQEEQRREKIDQLFEAAQQLQKEQRFNEAAEAMRQVLILDPSSSKANLWLDTFEDLWSYHEQKMINRDVERQTQRILQQADETRIPWSYDILYPKNWLEISAKRSGIQGSVGDQMDFELNRALETVQPEVNFDEQPFDQVMEFLTECSDMNIAVDWDDLNTKGVDRSKPVSLKLKDVKLGTVLSEVLSQVGGDTPLKFSVGEGLLRVASKEKLDRDKYTLVYDIRDLIVDIPRFVDGTQLDQPTAGFTSADAALANSDIFGSWKDDLEATIRDGSPDDRIVEEIMDIIRTTIETDSWRETGNGNGALRELNGQLIVYNTSEAHAQTRALLSQLREARALMIGVEARFLIVNSNFLEELGVDLDFVFNQGSAGYDQAYTTGTQGGVAPITDPGTGSQVLIPRALSSAGIIPAVPALGGGAMAQSTPLQPYGNAGYVPAGTGMIPQLHNTTPISAQQSSLSLADPRILNTGIPGSLASTALEPALNIAGSFLDNLQVDFLIRATQANQRSSIVQAPRLMMFNGQRAWVAIVRNRQYVSSVTPSVAQGAVGVQPVTQNVSSGTSLDVEGTISADRKYVTITVRTGLAQEPAFERFEVQRASGNSPGIFILLTDQETRGIRTTVSIPDGGTVLIGGLKQVGEIEVEAGVPILSKIPILKRAFTNTTKVKDTQTLLILLKTKILIQREAEEEAFPTLSSFHGG